MKKLPQILLVALMFLTGLCAYAVPARRVAHEYTQPDGTTVTLTPVGDEYSHYYLTEDGQVVVGLSTGYFFAVPDLNGAPVASSVKASDPAARSEEARTLLAGVSASAMREASASVARTKSKAAQAQRIGRSKAKAAAAASSWPSGIGLFPATLSPSPAAPMSASSWCNSTTLNSPCPTLANISPISPLKGLLRQWRGRFCFLRL